MDAIEQAVVALRAVCTIRPEVHFKVHVTASIESWAVTTLARRPPGQRQGGFVPLQPESVCRYGAGPLVGDAELVAVVQQALGMTAGRM